MRPPSAHTPRVCLCRAPPFSATTAAILLECPINRNAIVVCRVRFAYALSILINRHADRKFHFHLRASDESVFKDYNEQRPHKGYLYSIWFLLSSIWHVLFLFFVATIRPGCRQQSMSALCYCAAMLYKHHPNFCATIRKFYFITLPAISALQARYGTTFLAFACTYIHI